MFTLPPEQSHSLRDGAASNIRGVDEPFQETKIVKHSFVLDCFSWTKCQFL